MRGASIAVTALLALGFTFGGPAAPARAAVGFESAYQFESAFLTLHPGESGVFSAFFANTGTTSWVKGTTTQVNLAVCALDKVTCNTTSAYPSFNLGWLSPFAYASHQKDIVVPGDFSPFSYSVSIPRGQALGTYRFNGDLVLAATGERIRPEGYYHEAQVVEAPIALAVNPDFTRDEDNQTSSAVPGNGQHTYSFTTTLTGTLSFAVLPASDVVQNAAGSYSFCDKTQDRKADNLGGSVVVFTSINGFSVGASTILVNQTIPADGQIRVTVDSSVRNQLVRVVAWQDKSGNSQIDLTSVGDTTCNTYQPYDSANDGLMAVSGRKYYFGAPGVFGSQFAGACVPVFLHDTTNQVFSAGSTSENSLQYRYQANDIFRLGGVRVSLGVFKNELTASSTGAGDTVKVSYNPNADGLSEFEICTNAGSDAPSDLATATGSFDGGSAVGDDVRLTFTAPTSNATLTYTIQRALISSTQSSANTGNCKLGGSAPQTSDSSGAPAGSTFATIGAVTVMGGKQGTFTNFGLGDGGYCFRIVVQNPNVGLASYSNYRPVNIPGVSDASAPRSTSASLTKSAGFGGTLDAGDKIVIDFTESMSVAPGSIIRTTDSDCGSATNAGPALCSGNTSNTVSDIVCGTNATCTLEDVSGIMNGRLSILMSGNPLVITSGSTAGAQFPLVVTDVSGITDLSGNGWNISGSPDRLIR
jgi:hypothetical protein